MLDTTELTRLWQSDPRHQCRYTNLTLTPIGVVLGAGTLVIKAVTQAGDAGLDIAGNEEEILALLSATYGEAISPEVIPQFQCASRWLKKGENGIACIALAQAGLPNLPRWNEDGRRASERLFKAGLLVARQDVTPSQLMVGLGLLPRGLSVATWRKMAKAYNPDEPRDERGRWTSGGDTISDALNSSALIPVSDGGEGVQATKPPAGQQVACLDACVVEGILGAEALEVVGAAISGMAAAKAKQEADKKAKEKRCKAEWQDARELCGRLDDEGKLGADGYRGFGSYYDQCVRGQVSEDCGGNRVTR